MKVVYDFQERLAFSEGIVPGDAVMTSISKMVPNATGIRRASENDDRHGTDFWIDRTHDLPPLSVDMKNREFCPIQRFGTDDACVETTSVYRGPKPFTDRGREKPGWTLDYRKRTDFVVYTWPSEDGVRFWIVPFVPLCAAARANWRNWLTEYPERIADNKTYKTLSIYPHRIVIARAMREFMSGIAA